MAVTPRHPGNLYGSSGTGTTVGGSLAVTSLYAAVGTVALVFIAAQGAGQSIGDSTGWTRVYSATGAGTRTHTQAVFSHRITQADIDAGHTFAFPLAVNGPWDWWVMGYDGTDLNPIEAYTLSASSGDGTSVVAPSVTTTHNGCLIVECFGGTASTPTGPTVSSVARWRGSWGGGSSDFPALGIADQDQTYAGATGTLASGLSVSGSWVAGTIALRPPAPPLAAPLSRSELSDDGPLCSAYEVVPHTDPTAYDYGISISYLGNGLYVTAVEESTGDPEYRSFVRVRVMQDNFAFLPVYVDFNTYGGGFGWARVEAVSETQVILLYCGPDRTLRAALIDVVSNGLSYSGVQVNVGDPPAVGGWTNFRSCYAGPGKAVFLARSNGITLFLLDATTPGVLNFWDSSGGLPYQGLANSLVDVSYIADNAVLLLIEYWPSEPDPVTGFQQGNRPAMAVLTIDDSATSAFWGPRTVVGGEGLQYVACMALSQERAVYLYRDDNNYGEFGNGYPTRLTPVTLEFTQEPGFFPEGRVVAVGNPLVVGPATDWADYLLRLNDSYVLNHCSQPDDTGSGFLVLSQWGFPDMSVVTRKSVGSPTNPTARVQAADTAKKDNQNIIFAFTISYGEERYFTALECPVVVVPPIVALPLVVGPSRAGLRVRRPR